MRLFVALIISMFMLSSCAWGRSAMISVMDVITAPYHYLTDDEEDMD